jgi:hypothetical protein
VSLVDAQPLPPRPNRASPLRHSRNALRVGCTDAPNDALLAQFPLVGCLARRVLKGCATEQFTMTARNKILSTTAIATLAIGCAGRIPVATSVSPAPPVSCVGQKVENDDDVRRLARCTRVDGNLVVSGSVTTLEPLASVETVTGTLSVDSAPQLESLAGLERLRHVDSLLLKRNAELDDIGALHSLSEVRQISLTHNPQLDSLTGLEGVRSLERLTVVENGLYSLRGLGNLAELGELVVVKNPRLIELRALSGVQGVERVTIVGNRRLSGFAGVLPHLRKPPTFVAVAGNPFTVAETAHLSRSQPTRSAAGFANIGGAHVADGRDY